ncbi:MAG: site-specific integrase [Methanobrevibacter sp.]|nr:site-specific integrase [Methanobrevibacter sp.]
MNMNNNTIIDEFAKARRLKKGTKEQYQIALNFYSKFQQKPLSELLEEADNEEEQGIRWKKRKLKQRLINYRNYLYEHHVKSTADLKFALIKTFYKHHEIEIHDLPALNKKNIKLSEPLKFKDLPDKELIKKALKIANPLMRAIILFMSSSGCARAETLSLTVQDYLDATREYHNSNDIVEAVKIMHDKDIVPTFYLKRIKTNKYYYTFCSPEANQEIINYLLLREDLDNDRLDEIPLFKCNTAYFERHFAKINNTLDLGKIGAHNKFKSHILRKFHATNLYNDKMSLEEIDALQGRSKEATHSSYFTEDPNKLREKYISHLDCLTINLDVNNMDIKSPEYVELEQKYNEKESQFNDMEERLSRMEKMFSNVDQLNDDEILNLFSNKSK